MKKGIIIILSAIIVCAICLSAILVFTQNTDERVVLFLGYKIDPNLSVNKSIDAENSGEPLTNLDFKMSFKNYENSKFVKTTNNKKSNDETTYTFSKIAISGEHNAYPIGVNVKNEIPNVLKQQLSTWNRTIDYTLDEDKIYTESKIELVSLENCEVKVVEVDLNNDKNSEFVVFRKDNKYLMNDLTVYDSTGKYLGLIFEFKSDEENDPFGRTEIIDIDGDGKIEILYYSGYTFIDVYTVKYDGQKLVGETEYKVENAVLNT